MTRIYLDLDGVMADFDAHYAALFGHYHNAIPDDELWGKINSSPSFFLDMPLCKDGLFFFQQVRAIREEVPEIVQDLAILTACPKANYRHVATQKREWVRKHLSPDVTVLPVAGGSSKPLFMHAPGDILIDDFDRNTWAWERAGGRAILHKGDMWASYWALRDLLGLSR